MEYEAKTIVLECMRDLGDFVHAVAEAPEKATPESVAALPDVARAMAGLFDRL